MEKPGRHELARIIDVNLNRAREGIRVLEEVSRFISNDLEISTRLKSIRHGIVEAVSEFGFSRDELLDARDSEGDVGRNIQGELESRRENIVEIIASNFSRVEEALRVMEEFGKIIDSKVARKIKDLRYEIYTLEKHYSAKE
jgi:thiamine-phosphate pyrophosphorylase